MDVAHAAFVLRNLKEYTEKEMKETGGRSYALVAVDQEDLRCLEYAINQLEKLSKEEETQND